MIRRPPRSTLFPYHDALPISGFVEVLPGCTGILPGVFQVAFTPLFAGFLHLLPGFLSVLTGLAKILFTLAALLPGLPQVPPALPALLMPLTLILATFSNFLVSFLHFLLSLVDVLLAILGSQGIDDEQSDQEACSQKASGPSLAVTTLSISSHQMLLSGIGFNSLHTNTRATQKLRGRARAVSSGNVFSVVVDGQIDPLRLFLKRAGDDGERPVDGLALVPHTRVLLQRRIQVIGAGRVVEDSEQLEFFFERDRQSAG